MRKRIQHLIRTGSSFKREFRQQIRLLVTLTLGFSIAFAWRQSTFDLSQNFILFLTNIKNSNISSLLTSIFITLVCLILIFITSRFLKNGND